jgi:hypothetical protein
VHRRCDERAVAAAIGEVREVFRTAHAAAGQQREIRDGLSNARDQLEVESVLVPTRARSIMMIAPAPASAARTATIDAGSPADAPLATIGAPLRRSRLKATRSPPIATQIPASASNEVSVSSPTTTCEAPSARARRA